jgi:ribosomal protein S18 acetylase RimI-like enzyme
VLYIPLERIIEPYAKQKRAKDFSMEMEIVEQVKKAIQEIQLHPELIPNTIQLYSNFNIPKDRLTFCFELVKANLYDYYQRSNDLKFSQVLDELNEPNSFYLIHEQGFLSFQFDLDGSYPDEDEVKIPVCYLYQIQVSDSYQGKGLGTLMMETLETVGNFFGMYQVTLTVFKDNIKTIGFYENRGYSTDSSCPSNFDMDQSRVSYRILSKSLK